MLNLVSNAVKFTGEGGRVDVSLEVNGDVAEVRVADTGMGIPPEEQGRLFQRFFRSSLATEHAIQGTGLGLHIVRSIAEAHNGSVDVDSAPGVGTTFRFVVPLVRHVDRRTGGPGRGPGRVRPSPSPDVSAESEVEAGVAVAEPVGRHRVDVALADHDVELAGHLDLGLVLGVEQHPVVDLDASARWDPRRPPGTTTAGAHPWPRWPG